MSVYIMKVIPKPKEGTASVLAMTRKEPVLKASGRTIIYVGNANLLYAKT